MEAFSILLVFCEGLLFPDGQISLVWLIKCDMLNNSNVILCLLKLCDIFHGPYLNHISGTEYVDLCAKSGDLGDNK